MSELQFGIDYIVLIFLYFCSHYLATYGYQAQFLYSLLHMFAWIIDYRGGCRNFEEGRGGGGGGGRDITRER